MFDFISYVIQTFSTQTFTLYYRFIDQGTLLLYLFLSVRDVNFGYEKLTSLLLLRNMLRFFHDMGEMNAYCLKKLCFKIKIRNNRFI